MRYFRDLDVWQHARDLTVKVYRVTDSFPASERFGLTAQIRRAAVSLPVNIAEGCGRRTDREFARFLDIAMGSASELECLLILAGDPGFLDGALLEELLHDATRAKRMLHGFLSVPRKP